MDNRWEYRLVRKESIDGSDEWYSVQEVYFDDNGQPLAQTVDLQIEGDTISEIKKRLTGMINCLEEPVLDEQDIIPTVKPNEPDGLEVGPWEGMVHTDENNKTYIYESPDGGKTLYRREFGDYDNKKKINQTEEKTL